MLAAAVLTTLTVLGGVLVGGPSQVDPGADAPAADPSPTDPAAVLDGLEDLVVRRASFCAAVSDATAADALGDEVASTGSYDSGQRVRLTGDVRDVAHEFGCTWRSGGATARAWVFAPPVSPERARALVRAAEQADGCTRVPAPAYGSPGVALQCERGGRPEASYRGLFGDAWLTCTLLPAAAGADGADGAAGAADPDATVRAASWCAAVATAAAGGSVTG